MALFRKRSFSILGMLGLCILLSGCLVDVTSITGPSSTTTRKVVTFTVSGTVTDTGNDTRPVGIVLQIPAGTQVLRAHYSMSGGASGDLSHDASIVSVYSAEEGYQLYGGTTSSSSSGTTVTLKVWLSVPAGITPGTYTVKAAVGAYTSGVWTPQNPKSGGNAVTNFAMISGVYASSPFNISAGSADSTAPDNVTPSITNNGTDFTLDFTGYNEAAQGDVSKYRVYVSKLAFSGTAGRQLLDGTTSPTVTGFGGYYTLSGDIAGSVLFYFEIPAGSEYPVVLSGLSGNTTYYFAVTAVDVSGNESVPQVVSAMAVVGSISGAVTDGTSGLSNISVTIWDSTCSNGRSTSTNPDGSYSFGGLATGDYKIQFYDPSNIYAFEWYDNQQACNSATPVSVTAGQTTSGKDAVLALAGGISGIVTDGTNGLGNIYVIALDSNCFYVNGVSTNPDGTYLFGGLAAGTYKINFYDPLNVYAPEWYDNQQDCNSATPVSVTSGQTTSGKDAVLATWGGISGKVTDGASGLADVGVTVMDITCTYSSGWVSTDADGNYSIGELAPGSYKIQFYDYSHFYAPEWYNDKPDCNNADTVSVNGGQTTTLLDAVLTTGGNISGTVTNGTTGLGNISVEVYDSNCSFVNGAWTNGDGGYNVGGLHAGSYRIRFIDNWNGAYAYQWFNNKLDCGNATPVSVTDGQTTTGKDAVLTVGGRISGIVTGFTIGLGNIYVDVLDNNCSHINGTWTATDGSYSVGGLAPCDYKIAFYDYSNAYLSQWYNNQLNCNSANTVSVTSGQMASGKNAALACGIKNAQLCDNNNCFPYDKIQDAYNVADNGEIVEAHAISFAEDLVFGNDTTVGLNGGFDCPYGSEPSFTTIKSLRLVGGGVEISNIIIK